MNGDDKNIQVTNQPRWELTSMAEKLKTMIQGGRALTPIEAMALANYAVATQLNPFAGECYYIPGIGCTPGIAGWRKKAQEQLEYEAKLAKINGCYFDVQFVEATPGEAGHDPGAKDIAFKATLTDSLSLGVWRASYFATAEKIKKELGIKNPEDTMIRSMVGEPPKWYGIGVVYGIEKFTKEGSKLEMFNRNERAMKRAEKIAIRKRFPRVNLPEPTGYENDVLGEEDIKVIEAWHAKEEAHRREIESKTPAQLVSELGFNEAQGFDKLKPAPVDAALKDQIPPADQKPITAQQFFDWCKQNGVSDKDRADFIKAAAGDPTKALHNLKEKLGMI